MGNALGCAGLGERLAASARNGDAAEVRRLLEENPGLARCAAVGSSLNSPLHLAAAKGHHEVRAVPDCVLVPYAGWRCRASMHAATHFSLACLRTRTWPRN
jgi:hypothetical protein